MEPGANERHTTAGTTGGGQISLTKTSLLKLLDSVLYPNPNDSG